MKDFLLKVKNNLVILLVLIASIVVMNAGYGDSATMVRILFLWGVVVILSTATAHLYTKHEFQQAELAKIYLANALLVGLAVVGLYFVQK